MELQPADRDHPRNVKDLKLAWVWSMSETGANQTMPLVHNGIMYLANPGNIVQALDGEDRRVDLGRTTSVRNEAIGLGSMRNISIYEDKVFLATTDARLVALDAKNGRWSGTPRLPIARKAARHERLDRHHGKVVQGLDGCAGYGGGLLHQRLRRATGKQLWKFHTVARTGEPGGDTWGKLSDASASAARRGLPAATIPSST